MAIDAACGSSLAALYAGVRELTTGTSDVAIVMGGDAVQTPYAYVAFSKTHALSPKGRCRPFDAGADGIALAEGVGVAVLKRLADAERDGDRIYAVVKGVGASSDGRDKGRPALPEHRAAAVGPRGGPPADRGRQRVRVRWDELPRGPRRIHRRLPEPAERRTPSLARGVVRVAAAGPGRAAGGGEALPRRPG